MNAQEWESLCDGCGRCCLHKLECEDTGKIYYTDVACKLLDCEVGGCKNYEKRIEYVPECLLITPADAESFSWLPSTCAYRLLSQRKPLFAWHPLLSGRADSVIEAGVSVVRRVVAESEVAEDDYQTHIITWVK